MAKKLNKETGKEPVDNNPAEDAGATTKVAKPDNRVHHFRVGDVFVNIYAFPYKQGSGVYHRATLTRLYRNRLGELKRSDFNGVEDLENHAKASIQARDYIASERRKQGDQEAQQSEAA